MDNNSNMLQLCRLCLVKDDVNIPIFEEQGDIRQIFLKISSCLPVKVSRDDQLPKKICDGCSYKLDMLYEFWNTSANAEKQLLTWLGEAGMTSQMTDGTISAVAQQIKPADAFVKQETIDPPDIHMDDDEEEDKDYMKVEEVNNVEEPPPKRARRTAAVKAAIAIDQNSDDDDDSGEPMTKVEDDSEDSDNEDHEPAFVDVPSTSADDQPGPSGVSKDGVEAPYFDGSSSECVDCDKSFNTLRELKTHIQNLEAFLKVYCKKCERFIRTDESNLHSQSTYSCISCKAILDDDLPPTTHTCFHQDSPQETATKKKVQCAVCSYIFFSSDDLHSHIQDRHFSDNTMYCKCCKMSFQTQEMFTDHISREHNKTGNFSAKTKEFKHKRRKNSEKTYHKKCSQCPLLFNNKKDYLAHKRRAHEIFLCYICGRKMHINFLRTHLDMHENNKRYKCKFCEKRFRLPGTLRNHQMIHSSESNYQCQVCGKSFKKGYNLKVHMRIHSPVKPFECVICKKTFTTKQSRDNHLQRHK